MSIQMKSRELRITEDDLKGGIHKRLEYLKTVIGDQPALHFNEEIVTFAELESRANQLAHHIQLQTNCTRIATIFTDEVMVVVAIFAIMKLGRTWIPMSAGLPKEFVIRHLNHFGDSVLLLETDTADKIKPSDKISVINVAEMPVYENIPQYSHDAQDDDVSFILITSGSTGTPKSIPTLYRKVIPNLIDRAKLTPPGAPVLTSWGMINGVNIWIMLYTICQGGIVHRVDLTRYSIQEIHQRIREHRIESNCANCPNYWQYVCFRLSGWGWDVGNQFANKEKTVREPDRH